jgi:hypothetical protein
LIVQGNTLKAVVPLTFSETQVFEVSVDLENKDIIEKILFCESSNHHYGVWGDLNYFHRAYGIAQFQRRTFYWLAEKSGKNNLNWKNKEHQIMLLDFALENNLGYLWTCYRKLK